MPSPCCPAEGPQQEGWARCSFPQPWGCQWLAILWEQKREKSPLGQPSTEPGMGSQPGARKISGCFHMSKLSIPATPRCSAVLPPPLNAPAIQGCCDRPHSPFPNGDGRSRTESHTASARHYHPCPAPCMPKWCGSGSDNGSDNGSGSGSGSGMAWREGAGEHSGQLS